jgi:hypothetical protein
MKRFLTIGILAIGLAAGAAHAGELFVRFGPPPPPRREIVVVRPGPRYVWVPGYYRWAGGRYIWNRGYWALPPRHRAVWVPGYWTPRHGGYVWVAGYWR